MRIGFFFLLLAGHCVTALVRDQGTSSNTNQQKVDSDRVKMILDAITGKRV